MHLRRIGLYTVTLLLTALAGPARALTPVTILSPAPDSVVRGQVPIKVPASAVPLTSPTPGYVVIFIDGKFEAAVARPKTGRVVTYMWNTKSASSALGIQQVQDGKHEIRVIVSGQDGRQIGRTDRVEVFVQNNVRTPPSQVVLRYKFTPGVQHTYVQKIQIRQNDTEVYKARLVLRRSTDDVLPGPLGMIRERIDRDSAQSDQGVPVPFPLAGQSVTFNQMTNGSLIPGLKMRRTGQRPVLYMPILPAGPVKVGDTWSSSIKLDPMFQGIDDVTLPAELVKSTLQGFEWQNGFPTAKIQTTFSGNTNVLTQGVPTVYTVSGTRTTYFDWRGGRVVQMIDDYQLSTNTTATGVLGGTGGTIGTPGSPGPGYSPSPTTITGPSASGADSGYMKVLTTTQLTG